MSSFKRLNNSDVVTLPYIANKLWELTACELENNGVSVYTGKKLTGSFDPKNELKFNGRYERLVYDSVNHLYYQSYSSSLIDNTSNLLSQNYSSSVPYRPSGAYYNYSPTAYMVKDFPDAVGSEIKVLAISKDLYGTSLNPGTINISASSYHLIDDKKGNVYDVSGSSQVFVGNVFYSHGTVVITNQSYQQIVPVLPYAKDDYVEFKKAATPKKIYPLLNDDPKYWTMLTQSIVLSGSNTAYFTNNGDGTVTFNYSQSGVYPVYYKYSSTVSGSPCYSDSNYAEIVVNIKYPQCGFTIGVEETNITPTPTPTPTVTPTPTPTPTVTPTVTSV